MIKLIKSTFSEERKTKKLLADFIMKSSFLSMGEECRAFEENFAKKQESNFSTFVSSGSAANLVLIQALLNMGRLKKGDYVGVSALTWATNVMPLIQLDLKPVVLDCEIKTLNLSPTELLKNVKNLRALFITNALGFCDDIEKIADICRERNIILLEDNCESLGSRAYGKLLGNFSMASTFSFFVGHHLSTIEGGMICTDDFELNQMCMMVRAHGWNRNLTTDKRAELRKKHGINSFFDTYTFYDLAYNARPTEISGFLGNCQLRHLDLIVERREKNFMEFVSAANSNPDLVSFDFSHMGIISNFAMPVVCRDRQKFKKYIRLFKANNVEIRPVIAGDISQQPFYKKYIKKIKICKNANFIHQNGFYFGNNPELTRDEINLLKKLLGK